MKKKTCLALCLVLLLLASACGGGNATAAPSGGNSPASSAPAEPDSGFQNYVEDLVTESGGSNSAVYQNPNAKLIRRAELNIQTEQFDQSVEALNKLVGDCGGYFESASLYGGGRPGAHARRARGDGGPGPAPPGGRGF